MEEFIRKLQEKAKGKGKMPSISNIKKLLDSKGIQNEFYETTNIVESRSKGRRYVNSRREGKSGYRLSFTNSTGTKTVMDTSDPYYSYNSWDYAREILELLTHPQNID